MKIFMALQGVSREPHLCNLFISSVIQVHSFGISNPRTRKNIIAIEIQYYSKPLITLSDLIQIQTVLHRGVCLAQHTVHLILQVWMN